MGFPYGAYVSRPAPGILPEMDGVIDAPFAPIEIPAFSCGSTQPAKLRKTNSKGRIGGRLFERDILCSVVVWPSVPQASRVFQRATCSATLVGEVPP
jgi:hypothetical protein